MSYKDALTLYEELLASGTDEGQAKAMAHQMSSLADEMGGRYNELSARLDKRLDSIDSNLKWMMIVGGVMAASFFSNVLFIKLG
jgi:hypothetical protein